MRIMFKVLKKSIIYPLDNSQEKLEMTVEMLFKYLLGNPNSIMCDENVTHVTPRKAQIKFQISLSVPIGFLC